MSPLATALHIILAIPGHSHQPAASVGYEETEAPLSQLQKHGPTKALPIDSLRQPFDRILHQYQLPLLYLVSAVGVVPRASKRLR